MSNLSYTEIHIKSLISDDRAYSHVVMSKIHGNKVVVEKVVLGQCLQTEASKVGLQRVPRQNLKNNIKL